MSDRHERARAEAERQIHVYGDDFKARTLRANLNDAFVQGVEWADANPQPHTVTRGDFQAICFEIAGQVDPNMRRSEVLAIGVLGGLVALGVEVTDDE